jgi:hypothetical protein
MINKLPSPNLIVVGIAHVPHSNTPTAIMVPNSVNVGIHTSKGVSRVYCLGGQRRRSGYTIDQTIAVSVATAMATPKAVKTPIII